MIKQTVNCKPEKGCMLFIVLQSQALKRARETPSTVSASKGLRNNERIQVTSKFDKVRQVRRKLKVDSSLQGFSPPPIRKMGVGEVLKKQ